MIHPLNAAKRCVFATLIALVAMQTSTVEAEELPAPEAQVILTVSGNIAVTNAGDVAEFDRAMLEALPQVTLTTTTAWTEGQTTFQGPLVRDVLQLVEASGELVTATALNDYAVEIPSVDFEEYDVLLALLMDGERMSVRDKGPIWIVYPQDDHAELQTVEYNARWIWQLRSLNVGEP